MEAPCRTLCWLGWEVEALALLCGSCGGDQMLGDEARYGMTASFSVCGDAVGNRGGVGESVIKCYKGREK